MAASTDDDSDDNGSDNDDDDDANNDDAAGNRRGETLRAVATTSKFFNASRPTPAPLATCPLKLARSAAVGSADAVRVRLTRAVAASPAEGSKVGAPVGVEEGRAVGASVGRGAGVGVGRGVGRGKVRALGAGAGGAVGAGEGAAVGRGAGGGVGVGAWVPEVGAAVPEVGAGVGCSDGRGVDAREGPAVRSGLGLIVALSPNASSATVAKGWNAAGESPNTAAQAAISRVQ